MGKSESDVLGLLEEIYAAGLGDTTWEAALESIGAFFGAPVAMAFDFDRGAGATRATQAIGIERRQPDDLISHINRINPRMKYALARPGCHTATDHDALSEAEIRRSEFYDWLAREGGGVKYHIGSRMIDDGNVSSFVAVNLDMRREYPHAAEIEMFRRLTPHVANAWRISRRLAQTARIDDFNVLLLESAPWGVITLDHRGRVLTVNARARKIVGQDDGLRIEGGELRARRAADDRSLQVEIGRVLQTACGEGLHAGGTVAVGRPGLPVPYGLRVLPTRQVIGLPPDQVPFVAIFITDPVQPALPGREDLMVIFGLTPREAEITLLVAQGMSHTAAAEKMGIAPNTARAHLTNALAKTGARNRSALVGLIRGLPPRDEHA